MNKLRIPIAPIKINLAPFALAKTSHNLYEIINSYKNPELPLTVGLLIYCISIETGLKSSILSKDNSKSKKDFLKFKIRHDLKRAVKEFNKNFSPILDNSDLKIIGKVNKYYREKGLEYFTIDLIMQSLKGFRDLPTLQEIQGVNKKVILFLKANNYFIN